MDPHARRTRLLSRFHPSALTLTLSLLVACDVESTDGLRDIDEVMAERAVEDLGEGPAQGDSPAPALPDPVPVAPARQASPAERALSYLLADESAIRVETAVGAQLYAALYPNLVTPAALGSLRHRISADELGRRGLLLSGEFAPLAAPTSIPARAGERAELELREGLRLAQLCLASALICEPSAECGPYLATPLAGAGSLEQALVHIAAAWRGCTLAELDRTRPTLARALLADAAASHDANLVGPRALDAQIRRLAFLHELGLGSEVPDAWVAAVAESQNADGGLPPTRTPSGFGTESDRDTTGAMLWLWARRDAHQGRRGRTGRELLEERLGLESDPAAPAPESPSPHRPRERAPWPWLQPHTPASD